MDRNQKLRRVFVVEDEVMIAMHIEDLLTELGHEVTEMATSLNQALPIARGTTFDFAVLDVNLDGQLSFPIADLLKARSVPFLFASGYGSKGVTAEYRGAVRLQKPFSKADLAQAIGRLG
jgi:DNA-binding response OmpR family regulator